MCMGRRLIFAVSLLLLLASCDDGKIYDDYVMQQEDGIVVKLTGNISGISGWGSGYNIAVAGFGDGEYAVISKNVTTVAGEDDDEVELIMSGVTSQVKTVELCAIDRLRKRVVTFKSIACDFTADTLVFEVGDVDAGMFNAIQQSVFNVTCANCHGASNYAAAGLYLTEGKSYDALVNRGSRLLEGETLVVPGDGETSVLYKTLSSDVSSTWGYDHSVEVLSATTLDLIKGWIDNGAAK